MHKVAQSCKFTDANKFTYIILSVYTRWRIESWAKVSICYNASENLVYNSGKVFMFGRMPTITRKRVKKKTFPKGSKLRKLFRCGREISLSFVLFRCRETNSEWLFMTVRRLFITGNLVDYKGTWENDHSIIHSYLRRV